MGKPVKIFVEPFGKRFCKSRKKDLKLKQACANSDQSEHSFRNKWNLHSALISKPKDRILKEIRNIIYYDHLKLFVEECDAL